MVHCDAVLHLPRVLHVQAGGRVQGTLEHRARAVASADPRARQHRDCRLHADPALASAARFCGGLRKMGIGRGDRVALFLPNVPHYIAAYFGILRLGAVVVTLSPLYSVEELQQQLIDSSPRAMVTLAARAPLPTT